MKDYKRLTERDVDGTYVNYYEVSNEVKKWQEKHGHTDFLGTNITQILLERLADIEDKIENGTLIELPCKVGDTVWTINCWQEYGKKELGEPYSVTRYELHENKCSHIEISDKNYYRGEISIIARENYKGITPYVFPTKAEAEAKLKKLKGVKR